MAGSMSHRRNVVAVRGGRGAGSRGAGALQSPRAVPLGGDGRIHEEGRYRVRPAAYDVVREQTGPDTVIRIAYRGVGDNLWYRLEALTSEEGAVPPWPCWVNYYDMTELREFPVELAQVPRGRPPAAIVAASYGVGKRVLAAESVSGTTDLALAVGLVSNKLLSVSGIDAQGDITVPATFSLGDGTLAGFEVPLAARPDAISVAGGDPPPELAGLSTLPGAITTRFSDLGAPVDVEPTTCGQHGCLQQR